MHNILKIEKTKADLIGIIASGLCLVHCVATPFIFIVKACATSCCSAPNVPYWWKWIDYLFLVISFIAIYYAVKSSTKRWVKNALWSSWIILLFIIVNESFVLIPLPESFIYFPALSIVFLHLYNRKYCSCNETKCCTIQNENEK